MIKGKIKKKMNVYYAKIKSAMSQNTNVTENLKTDLGYF